MLCTFEDQETGELRSVIAANEAAARSQLGGSWTDVERTPAWTPCEIDELPAIYREAEAEEQAAHRAMTETNPMGKCRFTAPEALADFTATQEKHRKCQARRKELMRLMIAAGK
jgi:hypothetical protein